MRMKKYCIAELNKARQAMAKPIKETPVLYGKEATRFLRQVTANEKRDHSAAYTRAKTVYDRFLGKTHAAGHVHAHAR